MSKAQMHNGYKSAVFSKDVSNCNHLEGFLKKKNSHGVWQKRWFYLNNEFMIYKKDQKASDKDIKGAIDLSEVETVEVSAKGDIDVVMKGGQARLQLKGNDQAEGNAWEQHIYQRLDWLHEEAELQEEANRYEEEMALEKEGAGSRKTGQPERAPVQYSGWLKKKSPKKYAGMQDRFVKVENNYMHYFKSEADAKNVSASLGGVSLETMDWVRPYDSTPDCTTLEVQAGGRVFLFVAESAAAMREWVQQLSLGREIALAALEKKAAAKLAASTPYRIRIFDDKGPEALASLIRDDIEDIFPLRPPEDCTEEEEVAFPTAAKQLQMAREVVDYLEDMLPEVQKVLSGNHKRPARLDVLAVAMIEINSFLALRLTTLVDPSVMNTQGITLGDLHVMIGWLTHYKLVLSDIYCPPAKPGDPSPSTFPLFQVIPDLCQWFVEGVPRTTCEGAAKHIKGHVSKIFENFVQNPTELLQRHHSDGTFYTHAPTDIWELLHHHLSLATSTSSPVLSFLVANAIVEELHVIIRKTTAYVTQMNTPDPEDGPPALYREIELELLCALSNDIALHFEQVQMVVEKFNIDEIRNKVDTLFDAVSDKLISCGQACLRRLSTLVMEDMSENMQEIFTLAWLGDPPPVEPPTKPSSQISVALATISDYLADLNEFLVPFWSSRLVDFLLEVLVTKYFKLVMKVRDVKAPLPPPPEESPKSPSKSPSGTGPPKRGLLSHMSSKMITSARDLTKVMVEKVTESVTKGMRASEVSVALIENDTTAIEEFFSDKTSNAAEYVKILADLAELLIAEPDDLSRLLMSRINQCPPAAQAILESATRCADLRDDLSKDELDMIFLPLEPMLKIHTEAVGSEVTSVAPEHRLLCGLYCDLGLTQKKRLGDMLMGSKNKSSSTRKILESSSSMAYERQQSIEEKPEDEEDGLDHVLDALDNVEEEYLTQVAQEEEEEAKKEAAEQKALEAGRAAINFEGLLGKKSPAHNLWQDRWFKLMTRVEASETGEFQNHHTLLWYKKQGGAVIKAVPAKTISGMQLISSPRALAYNVDNFRLYLTHDPEGAGGLDVREWRSEDDKETKFVFSLHLESGQSDGKDKDKDKDMILKAKSVDLLLQWMNHFAVAAKLEYNASTGVWVKGDRARKIAQRRAPKRPSAIPSSTNVAVVNDMSQKRVMQAVVEEDEGVGASKERLQQAAEMEVEVCGERALHMEGEMEKKSPAHNLWQGRWFKLMTKQRESTSGMSSNVYTLMWYKKKGGSVIKSLSSEVFSGLILLSSATPLVYSKRDHCLHQPDPNNSKLVGARPVKPKDGSSDGTNSFLLQCSGGVGGSGGGDKDVVLRVDSVARLLAWVNCLTAAGKLEYSNTNDMWLPGSRGIERTSSISASEEELKVEDNDKEDGDERHQGEEGGDFAFNHVGGGEAVLQRTIFVEGELEKKSPAHNLWQGRWFKLSTRHVEGANIYTFMWFKKKDSSVLKSVSADAISGVCLLSCARPIVYSQRDHCLHPADLNNPLLVGALGVKESAPESSTYSFVVQCKAGAGGGGGGDKDITLRTDSVERLMLWVNSLAEAARLEYSESAGAWQPGDRQSIVVMNPKASMRIASLSLESEGITKEEEASGSDEARIGGSDSHDHNGGGGAGGSEGKTLEENEMVEGAGDEDACSLSDRSSDSEVDLSSVEKKVGLGSAVTSLDFERRQPEATSFPSASPAPPPPPPPPPPPLSIVTKLKVNDDDDDSDEDDEGINSPLHKGNSSSSSSSSHSSDVMTAPVFDMSAFESRGGERKERESVVDMDDGGSDQDIREYRMSDCDDDQKLKPAGCSGCVVM